MTRFVTFLISLLSFSVYLSFAIECQTCDEEACQDSTRWVIETCPPRTRMCYRFTTGYGKVFRRGCANYDCQTIPGLPEGSTCNTCDSDRCNGYVPHRGSHGAGDVWNAATSSLHAFIAPILFIILA